MILFAAEAASPLTKNVVDWCLPVGLVIIVLGILVAVYELTIDFKLKAAAAQAANAAKDAAPGGAKAGDAAAQGALVSTVTAVTELAKALKDLHRSGQIMTIGVLVLLVAALAAGLDAVGQT